MTTSTVIFSWPMCSMPMTKKVISTSALLESPSTLAG